jgi:hypothetical protein
MSEQDINKRLRSVHSDFDFLLDANVISSDLYDELTQKIPRRLSPFFANQGWTGKSASTTAPTSPAAAPADVAPLTTQMSRTSVSSGHKSPAPPPPTTPSASMSPPPPAYGLAQAEALYNYAGADEGDLPLHGGDRIIILEYVNNGIFLETTHVDWWRGEGPNGQQGIFPSNYVRKIEAPEKGFSEKGAAQYQGGYPGQHAPVYAQPIPQYQQPVYQQPPQQQYQQQAPPPQQQEEHHESKLAQFGKNYGKTFVNATAW